MIDVELVSLIPTWDQIVTDLAFDPDAVSREMLPLPSFADWIVPPDVEDPNDPIHGEHPEARL